MRIPTVDEQPMLPVWPYVGQVIGRRRSAVLDLARRYADGDTSVLPFAVYRIGRRYLVRTAELRRFVGCDPTDAETPGGSGIGIGIHATLADGSTHGVDETSLDPGPPPPAPSPKHSNQAAARPENRRCSPATTAGRP